MKTPTLGPTVESDRIVWVDDAEEPPQRLLYMLLGLALVAAMALGGGIVYAWQQGDLRERDRLVQTSRVDLASARNDAGAALATIGRLRSEVTRLESNLEAQRAEHDIQAGRIGDALNRVERAEARLNDVKDDLAAITGPRVANGRHLAFLLAAGTAQSPPMMAIDPGRWFTGDAARRAAAADGVLTGSRHLFGGRYVRNTDHGWRILPVGTGALFTVRHYGGATVPTNLTFTTLASVLDGGAAGFERIAHDPFWVEVHQHTITSGLEQEYRAP